MNFWNILILIVLISVIIMLVAENRHPVKSLAWILVLCFLPVIGLVLYIFFGLDNRRKRLISNVDLREFKFKSLDRFGRHVYNKPDESEKDLMRLLWGTNMSIPFGGNDIKVYTGFDTMFEALMKDIREAKHHIHFEFFKFEDDETGREIAKLLMKKVAEGVEVRVQYDDAVNLTRKRFFKTMKEAGVEIQPFLKVTLPFLSSETNYRNHRKIVVVDGQIGYLGGMNIADRYSKGIRGGIWRDTHIRVAGPAVSEMQTCFLMDWQYSSKQHLATDKYYPAIGNFGNIPMQIANSGPMDEWRVIMQGIVKMISRSRNYIYIQSPYLIPTEPVLMALRNAALSGVDVRIMIPYKGDKGILPPLATRSYVKDVIEAGVKVYFYENGYLHSKSIVSDDHIATIGSTNMDVRSYEQNFEINAFIYDTEFAVKMRDIFLEDMQFCSEVIPEIWEKRPFSRRFPESIGRLFSPLL